MRKLLQTLWLPLIFLILPLEVNAQNGWVAFGVPAPGGQSIHFGNASTGIIINTSGTQYLRTSDGGNTWQTYLKPDTSFQKSYNKVFFVNSQTGWIGGSYVLTPLPSGFIYKTTNSGLSWGPQVSVYSLRDIQFLNENTGYIATGDIPSFVTEGGAYKSTNGGASWIYFDLDQYTYFTGVSFINTQTGWLIGHYGDDVGIQVQRIYRTTNGGVNFAKILNDSTAFPNPEINPIRKIQFLDQNTGYLLRNKLLKSTNAGDNWSLIDTNIFTGNYIRNLFFINKDTGWITTGPTGKIFRTSNGGVNWTVQNTGQAIVSGEIYFENGLTGWAMAYNTTLLKTTNGGITAIHNISTEIPADLFLYQNYPNPFNPTTKIKFDIPKQGNVKLTIYDMSGKEVSVLVNSELKAGSYEYNFDGSGLSSGVYFYKLQSGGFIKTERMVLVK
ncbi:MAG: T9SS type A sorting domain-containing protein [Ignavibacteriae bacterium]|nr:T9SS type A sorting domain-containing protein [Ignavibacteriota bacterium]